MPTVELHTPIRIQDNDYRTYEEAGIKFGGKINGEYTKALIPESSLDLAIGIAEMPERLQNNFQLTSFDNTPVQIAYKTALNLISLHFQQEKQSDGFPFPTERRPFTWKLNPLVIPEIHHLNGRLKELGIDEMQVGMEFETSANNNAVEGYDRASKLKTKILSNPTVDTEKKQAISGFNDAEILMYEIIELNKRTKDIVEHLFGNDRTKKNNYYDAEGVLELQLKHDKAENIIGNRTILLETLYEKASSNGLILHTPSQHVSFSFWKGGENILEPTHPEFKTTGKAILEGITKALYDSFPMYIEPYRMQAEIPIKFELTTSREGYLRLADGRVEVRFGHSEVLQDPNTIIPIVMAGAAYGLNPKDKDRYESEIVKGEIVKRAYFESTAELKMISHTLQGSLIEDGKIAPPLKYVAYHAATLAKELEMINSTKDYVQSDMQRLFTGTKVPECYGFLLNLFKNIKINNDKTIEWPDHYKHIAPGTENPPNIQKLKEEIKCKGMVDGITITGSYNINSVEGVIPDSRTQILTKARMERMANSAALTENLSPEFYKTLVTELETHFGIPKISEQDKDEVRKALAESKWEYIGTIPNLFRTTVNNITDYKKFELAVAEVRHEELPKLSEGANQKFYSLFAFNSAFVFISPEVMEAIIKPLKEKQGQCGKENANKNWQQDQDIRNSDKGSSKGF